MRRYFLILIAILFLVPAAQAAYTAWQSASGCWTATDGVYNLTMWNTTTPSSFTIPGYVNNMSAYIIVAGGGGGGDTNGGGGGGAGGVRINSTTSVVGLVPGSTYWISVGAGGAKGAASSGGFRGGNTSFSNATWSLNATGGGGGASNGNSSVHGGSGGGGHSQTVAYPRGLGNNGSYVPSEGNDGGSGQNGAWASGGGGGAGAVGATGAGGVSGAGGTGITTYMNGTGVMYACGGGGGDFDGAGAAAGCSIAGVGASGAGSATSGTTATGGGGGGAGSAAGTGGDGGSGILIIRYSSAPANPAAGFTANKTFIQPNEWIKLTDTSTGSPPITTWDYGWGDGTANATTQNPEHQYTAAGVYTLYQNVSNGARHDNLTRYDYINVINPPTLSLLPYPKNTGLYEPVNITVSIQNMTAPMQYVFTNFTFNASQLQVLNVYTNTSTVSGLSLTSAYSNTAGFVSVNITNSTVGGFVQPSTLTFDSIANVQFNTTVIGNASEPLNFNLSANRVLFVGESTNRTILYNNTGMINASMWTFELQIQDATTHVPITDYTVFTYAGAGVSGTTTSTTSYTTITTGYGALTFLIDASGYYTTSRTYFIDADNKTAIAYLNGLTSAQPVQIYQPHQVRFVIVDGYGVPQQNVNVTVNATGTTLQDTNWLSTMFGMGAQVTPVITNATLTGWTGTDGSTTFTLLASVEYKIYITDSKGTVYTRTLYPKDEQYEIRIGAAVAPALSSWNYNALLNTSLYYHQPTKYLVTMGLNYSDISGRTTNLDFTIFCRNNGTLIYHNNFGAPGTGWTNDSHTIPNVRGESYIWNFTAVRV